MLEMMEVLFALVFVLLGFMIGYWRARQLAGAEREKLEQARQAEMAAHEALKHTALEARQQLVELKYQYGQLERDHQALLRRQC